MNHTQKEDDYLESLEVLHSIGKKISANLDVHTIMQEVTDSTTALTGAHFGAFFYNNTDESGETFSLYTLSGAPREAFEKFGVPRHTGVFHPTFVEKKVVRVGDITKDDRFGKNSPHSWMPKGHLPVKSYLAVPVISKTGEAIGGLLYGHPEPDVFQGKHEEIVLDIAAQAAISLHNTKLLDQVKELNKKKDEFIALASHELKTPLTSVKGYLQVLQRTEQDSLSKQFINKALDQVNRLNKLVEELLHLSRMEAGKMEYTMENFDINEMVSEVIDGYCHSCQSHDISFSSSDSNPKVRGDKQRIEQVVLNLLSNAVKYSPEANKVEVSVDAFDDEVFVRVRDYGEGLSKHQHRRLFERFYRADNSSGVGGLGLGLYHSKQIIDRHNGTIGVKSAPLKGSEFFFSLKNESKRK